jgi:predicted ribosome quality control (RQC) complex YloA/Tae2 family protein
MFCQLKYAGKLIKMQIQKPTVLDAARLAGELKSFADLEIDAAFAGYSNRQLFIVFRKSETILRYSVDKNSSYMGTLRELPGNTEKTLAGIEGYYFADIAQVNNDRILQISLEKKGRLGKKINARLIIELIPNTGDVYFAGDDFTIKSSLRKKRKRIYEYPAPLKKPTVLNIDKELLNRTHKADQDIFTEIYGLNERDILNLSPGPEPDVDELFHDLTEYVALAAKPGPAWIIARGDEYIGFSLVKPRLREDEIAIEMESALLMYQQYYSAVAGSIDEKQRTETLAKLINTEIFKTEKKIAKIKKELVESEKADLYKTYGELILANINKIARGAASVALDSLDDDSTDKITIKLNPAKTVPANAKEYFKKSKKAAASKETLESRLVEAEQYLDQLNEIKNTAHDKPDLLEERLMNIGLLTKKAGKAARKPVERRKPYRVYRASCGWEILIGKSNKDNDELTFHIASKEDYWFHAWQAAGSHTVLRVPDKSSKPDRQTLLEAASMAAYHSKARNSSKVPVAYTQVKYVRKPRKFPPGKVLVEREKQLMVKPADPDDFLPTE